MCLLQEGWHEGSPPSGHCHWLMTVVSHPYLIWYFSGRCSAQSRREPSHVWGKERFFILSGWSKVWLCPSHMDQTVHLFPTNVTFSSKDKVVGKYTNARLSQFQDWIHRNYALVVNTLPRTHFWGAWLMIPYPTFPTFSISGCIPRTASLSWSVE